MALNAGTIIGPYEVAGLIGQGGMGEVYRARDTKLDRDVALKVLPDAFTSDPDRLARFEREAKVLASLNHPNIGHIYGLEEAEGTKALVLELVEGPTLADRIADGPIPVDDALPSGPDRIADDRPPMGRPRTRPDRRGAAPIAKQIAEALEAAHEQGIIQCATKVHTTSGWKIRPSTSRFSSVATCTVEWGNPPVEGAGTTSPRGRSAIPRAVTRSES